MGEILILRHKLRPISSGFHQGFIEHERLHGVFYAIGIYECEETIFGDSRLA